MMPDLNTAPHPEQPHRLIPVFAGTADVFSALPEALRAAAAQTADLRRFKAQMGETLLLASGAEQWLLAGLGEPGRLTRASYCEAVGRGCQELHKAGAGAVGVWIPGGLPWSVRQSARYTAEAVLMAGYAFAAYRTRDTAPPLGPVTLAMEGGVSPEDLQAGLNEGRHTGQAIALTRDLINQPAAVATPEFIAEAAHTVAEAVGARYHRIQGEDLAREGYEALYAVGRGSEHPPALVTLEYGTPGAGRPTVVLVGKGVTFDSGGLDLKTRTNMALMKKDMGGAATVLGGFSAIVALGLPVHLVAVLGLVENAVDGRSYRPGDILRSKQGITIEITSTDAEGRVVLADALALARAYRPHYLIDLATLTGACRVALGKEIMGLFCDDATLRSALLAASEATGDPVWPLPLWAPYRKALDSAVADLANAPSEPMAGAIVAALFLKEFAGEVAWAHLDCYAWSDGDHPLYPKGGSGQGVRLLVELMSRLIKETGNGV